MVKCCCEPTGLVELLSKVVSKSRVTVLLITAAGTHGDEQTAEVPRDVPSQGLLQPLAVVLLVCCLDGPEEFTMIRNGICKTIKQI